MKICCSGLLHALWLALFLIVLGPLPYGFAEWRKARVFPSRKP